MELVFSLLTTVVGEVVMDQPGTIEARVRTAISALSSRHPIRIETHPEDAPYLDHLAAELRRQTAFAIDFRHDPELPRGAARLISGPISLESFPLRHLQRLREALASRDLLQT